MLVCYVLCREKPYTLWSSQSRQPKSRLQKTHKTENQRNYRVFQRDTWSSWWRIKWILLFQDLRRCLHYKTSLSRVTPLWPQSWLEASISRSVRVVFWESPTCLCTLLLALLPCTRKVKQPRLPFWNADSILSCPHDFSKLNKWTCNPIITILSKLFWENPQLWGTALFRN